jgi:hypothetical protein
VYRRHRPTLSLLSGWDLDGMGWWGSMELEDKRVGTGQDSPSGARAGVGLGHDHFFFSESCSYSMLC